MSKSAIEVDGVWKNFRLYHERNQYLKAAILRGRRARYEEFWALRDINLKIPHGTTLGLIGSNGSGKSTLLKCLARILYPNEGSVSVDGRLCALLELGAGFHPELSGRENVFLNGAILGLSRREIENKFDEIVEFAGLEKFIDTPVKNFSNGMQLRLGFSIASFVDPEILLIDEVLAVGDQIFQRKCADRIDAFRKEGRTIVIVSHGMSSIMELCTTTVWLERGEVRQLGPSAEVISAYTGESYTAAEATPGEAGTRWGSGEVEITAVRVVGEAGTAETFSTGETVCIELTFTAHANINDTVFAVKLYDSSGNELWASSTRQKQQYVERLLPSGKVRLTIPKFLLLSGVYPISIGVISQDAKRTYDWWEKRIQVEVRPGMNLDNGILALESTWDLSTARR